VKVRTLLRRVPSSRESLIEPRPSMGRGRGRRWLVAAANTAVVGEAAAGRPPAALAWPSSKVFGCCCLAGCARRLLAGCLAESVRRLSATHMVQHSAKTSKHAAAGG
jgi:hypothetical protein